MLATRRGVAFTPGADGYIYIEREREQDHCIIIIRWYTLNSLQQTDKTIVFFQLEYGSQNGNARGLPFWVNRSWSGVKTQGNTHRNLRTSLRLLTLCFTFGGQSELLAPSGCRQLKVKLKSIEEKHENVSSNCLGPDVGEHRFKSILNPSRE